MNVFRSWFRIAPAIAFGLVLPGARAEMITPDSIPNPPSSVGSANGTPVPMSNVVATQYEGLGLNFNAAAITNTNGNPLWAPVSMIYGSPPAGAINYTASLSGSFVSPGSSTPITVSSLAVEIAGNGTLPLPALSLHVYGSNGQILPITPLIGNIANTQDWTFTGPDISSFSAAAVPPPNPNGGSQAAAASNSWGIAAVSFTPSASTPEPSSLVLAGLGAFGLAARLVRRRARRIA